MITALSGVALIALFVQLVKSFLEAGGLDPAGKLHDPLIWLLAFGSGIAGYIGDAAIHSTLSPALAEDAAGRGLLAALAAVGTYHLATHPLFSSDPTTATVTVGSVTTTAPAVVTLPEPLTGGAV